VIVNDPRQALQFKIWLVKVDIFSHRWLIFLEHIYLVNISLVEIEVLYGAVIRGGEPEKRVFIVIGQTRDGLLFVLEEQSVLLVAR